MQHELSRVQMMNYIIAEVPSLTDDQLADILNEIGRKRYQCPVEFTPETPDSEGRKEQRATDD